ncbi:MAG: transcriptional regulator, partial [bacterium]|nr:transcriptional regulator [bacterium]
MPFRVAEWRIDPSRNLLVAADREIRIEPKAMDVLIRLTDRPGQVVSKAELLAAVWPQQFVTEHALTVAIYQLRKALGDGARTPRFIETIRQRGYRWLPAI